MNFRLPENRPDRVGHAGAAGKTGEQTGMETLEAEILAEQAASLGRAGRAVERALDALNALPADAHPAGDGRRPALLKAAARAVHHFFIQRELCGLRRHDDAIAHYRIPAEVLVRLGAK